MKWRPVSRKVIDREKHFAPKACDDAFARLRFPGNSLLFGLLLLTVMLPSQMTLIPNFLLMRDLHFLDTLNALIWPGAANVFGVFLLRQFFMQIP